MLQSIYHTVYRIRRRNRENSYIRHQAGPDPDIIYLHSAELGVVRLLHERR
jgi:hypothetical protein